MSTPSNISGSRSAAILGVSPYRTNLDIWLEIMESRMPGFCKEHGYKFEKFEGNNQTAFGSAFEDAICAVVERVHNIEIGERETMFADLIEGNDYITCHVDGLTNIGDVAHLVENKTTSADYFYNNFSEKLNRIPLSYMCQIQHNLYLTGLQKCMMNVLVFPKRVDALVEEGWTVDKFDLPKRYILMNERLNKQIDPMNWVPALADMGYLKTFIIERDDDLIKLMLDKYQTFWNENIIGGKMPDVATLDDIKSVYREPFGTVVATEQVERWNEERKLLMQEKKELEKRIDELKTLELEFMRTSDKTIDTETRDKTFLYNRSGKKIASYDEKIFR